MIAGIAVPVALMVVVTSVSLGLVGGATVASPDVDYWIVPADASSAVVDVGGPQFGEVHPVSERVAARDDVSLASPVLVSLIRAEAGERSEYVLAVGVVPSETPFSVSGVSTAGLTPGDPHYENGSFAGPMTDEAIASGGAASLLDVTAGDAVTLRTATGASRTMTLTGVDDSGDEAGNLPIVVVHLGELQTLTGTAAGDRADQLLVQTTDPGVRPALEAVYPQSEVIARGGLGASEVVDSGLALAMAVSALLVSLVVGTLFAATTIGLAVAERAPERAVLAAVGVSSRSRAALIAVEALAVSLVGGVVGVALGVASLPVVDAAGRRLVADVAVTQFHPLVGAYGLAVAGLIGLVVVPYLTVMGRRTASLEVLYD